MKSKRTFQDSGVLKVTDEGQYRPIVLEIYSCIILI